MASKTKRLTTAGIFAGLVFLLGMTPYGLIPLGFINLTIVHIPVIVGAMVTDKKTALALGASFGLASTLAAFGLSLAAQSGLAVILLGYSPIAVIIMCMLPRLAVPMTTRLTYNTLCKTLRVDVNGRINKKKHSIAITAAAVVGSLTNTVLYLGIMGIFFAIFGIWSKFAAIFSITMLIGASSEAIAAALIANAVVPALKKSNSASYASYSPDTVKSDEEDSSSYIEDESSIEEDSVAIIPATDSLIPSMDAIMQKRHDRCMKYLDDGNTLMADSAFDAFVSEFSSGKDSLGAHEYAIMRFIEKSKYATAAARLTRLMKQSFDGELEKQESKQIVLGIMNIIRASVINDAENPVRAQAAEQIFNESTEALIAGDFTCAADKFAEYIEDINAKDRIIKPIDEPNTSVPEIEPTVALRELSGFDDNTEEGVSESKTVVIPNVISMTLPSGANPTSALELLKSGKDAQQAFEDFVNSVSEDSRIDADRYVMLTYFERRDYINALGAIIRCLRRGYSQEILSADDINSTVTGILTIVHTSLRVNDREKTAEADRIMEKAAQFYKSGAYLLSAQMLEKYFVATGLAKSNSIYYN